MHSAASPPDINAALLEALRDAVEARRFVRLTLAGCGGIEKDLKSVIVRPVVIKRQEKLSLTYRYQTRDIVKNHSPHEMLSLMHGFLDKGAQTASLLTTEFDLAFDLKTGRQHKTKPSHDSVPDMAHDRAKRRAITPGGRPYLEALGITGKDGRVLNAAQDKFRQINRFVEIIDGLVRELPPGTIRKIIDMGAGKGYLTFALYDHLARQNNRKPRMHGIELRRDLVDLCNRIAGENDFDGLTFAQGSIAGTDCAGTNLLVALHACDTATDDALAKGIKAETDLIVVAPCCHKQIRREMEAAAHGAGDLGFILRHGIFMERMAEMTTDALRALLLEAFGYDVKVFEFISDVHTPKNVMLTALRRRVRSAPDKEILARFQAAKAVFGIKRHFLEDALGL